MKQGFSYKLGLTVVFFVLVGLQITWSCFCLEPQRQQLHCFAAPASPPADQPEVHEVRPKTRSFNILILGVDAPAAQSSRSDLIMVARVFPEEKRINLVSIPRDLRVTIPGIGLTKINHAHYLGCQEAGNHGGTLAVRKLLENLLQVKIDFYLKLDFAGFAHFIDTIGGLELTLPHPVGDLPEGRQHLTGEQTLKLVRERKSLAAGDYSRQANQALVVTAVAAKLLRPRQLLRLPELLEQVQDDLVDTNLKPGQIMKLVFLLQDSDQLQWQYVQIPGKSAMAYDALLKRQLSFWIAGEEQLLSISKTYLQEPETPAREAQTPAQATHSPARETRSQQR